MYTFQVICLFQIIFLTSTEANASGKAPVQKFEGDGCGQLIPSFINHIIENGNDGECEQAGEYPKPGDCTVFFKCIRGRGRILPFLQYCATGYTFIDDVCIPNTNSSDCPQFNCFPAKTVADASQATVSFDDERKNEGALNTEFQKSAAPTESAVVTAAQKSSSGTYLVTEHSLFKIVPPFFMLVATFWM